MTEVEKRLLCLLCCDTEDNSSECTLHHICAHLLYRKFACSVCTFRGYTEDEALFHQCKTSHTVVIRENRYKEMLCTKIYMDCIRFTDSGREIVPSVCEDEPLLSSMESDSDPIKQASSNKTTPEIRLADNKSNSEGVKNSIQKRKMTKEKSLKIEKQRTPQKKLEKQNAAKKLFDKSKKRLFYSSFDEEPPSRFDSSWYNGDLVTKSLKQELIESDNCDHTDSMNSQNSNSTATSRHNNGKMLSDNQSLPNFTFDTPGFSKFESSSVQNTLSQSSPVKSKAVEIISIRSFHTKVTCKKCNQSVTQEYVERRQHVTSQHIKDESEIESPKILSQIMRLCFPGCLIYSDEQCTRCGKIYRSECGRREHVRREHEEVKISCIFKGCSRQDCAPSQLKRHILLDHGIDIKSHENEKVLHMFTRTKFDFYARLAPMVRKYFPINLNGQNVYG